MYIIICIFFLFLVDELKGFGRALMQCKSNKERQERLIDSLGYLSYNYPDIYSQIVREIKKREIEFNDPSRITKWVNVSTSDACYTKLHEALMLVNGNNTKAKEQYTNNLKQLLVQTIENKTNIEVAVKICSLVEKSSHLSIIYE